MLLKQLSTRFYQLLFNLKCEASLHLVYVYARLLLAWRLRRERNMSLLVLPPWSPRSLGDEAMECALLDYLESKEVSDVTFISYQAQDDWSHLPGVTGSYIMEPYFLGGRMRDLLKFARTAANFDRYFILGADVLDGTYNQHHSRARLWTATVASWVGVDVTIVSFSVKDDLPDPIIRAFKKLPASVALSVRDPDSHRRLSQHVVQPVIQAADIAFLLDPGDAASIEVDALEWIQAQKRAGRPLVGLNINHHLVRLFEELTATRLVQAYLSVMLELQKEPDPPSFLIIPHDFAQGMNDMTLAEELLARVPSSISPFCRIFPSQSAKGVKLACGMIDIMLSGRMHIAIACLGQHTPVASITYQEKFSGLYELFDLPDLIITPQESIIPNRLSDFFVRLYRERGTVAGMISGRLPSIKRLARANLLAFEEDAHQPFYPTQAVSTGAPTIAVKKSPNPENVKSEIQL